MFDSVKIDFNILTFAVIIAIILGPIISIFFILMNEDSYSSIYIISDNIIRDSSDNSVIYTYGVKSHESGIMDYSLNTYINNTLIKTKQFSLRNGEVLDGQDKITLPGDVVYPLKIRLELLTKTSEEEVHFWLEG